ncbi:thioredoxin family protein [Flavobacteriaceae bacterium AU392]|nr:thioredoxin family protein [Flavobacteriaceae bacterium]RKM84791.1 thioredoxin family protein [Flavobacteriaceae bacterium AU392]
MKKLIENSVIINQKSQYITIIFFLITFLFSIGQQKTNPNNQSEELGKVTWYRDYDEALKKAKSENKDVLILFQEVPGCSTCRNYGHNVLSHPLMVEAIEDQFIPLAIYNNKEGKDKQILQLYNEPSWNNPVVRIVNAKGENVVNRIAGNYSAKALYSTMTTSLEKANKPIPEYMKLLETELLNSNNNTIKETYFKMYCFWTGEKHLGKVDGVLSTEAGFMGGHEVVKVKFDPNKVNQKNLSVHAKQANFSPITKSNYRTASNDVKYYLKHTNYKFLPLTELQKTKINSALGLGVSPNKYLSPKQLKWLNEIKHSKTKQYVLFNQDFFKAWDKKNSITTN